MDGKSMVTDRGKSWNQQEIAASNGGKDFKLEKSESQEVDPRLMTFGEFCQSYGQDHLGGKYSLPVDNVYSEQIVEFIDGYIAHRHSSVKDLIQSMESNLQPLFEGDRLLSLQFDKIQELHYTEAAMLFNFAGRIMAQMINKLQVYESPELVIRGIMSREVGQLETIIQGIFETMTKVKKERS